VQKRGIATRTKVSKTLPASEIRIPRKVGFVSSSLSQLGTGTAVVEEALDLSRRITSSLSQKPYLTDTAVRDLDESSSILQLALTPVLIASVTEYLEVLPRLTSISILESTPQSGRPSGSQLFHCDYEDVRQVKVFLHCTNVTAANGPLYAVPAERSGLVKRKLGYRYGGHGFRVADDAMKSQLNDKDIVEFVGPPGALTFIDTCSCFHYGSRMAQDANTRIVVQFQYMSPSAFDLVIAGHLRRPPVAKEKPLSRLDQMVLGFT